MKKDYCQCKFVKKSSSGSLCESLSFLQEMLKQKTLQSWLSILAPSSRLVVGKVHLQISFIVLLLLQIFLQNPPKRNLSSSDRIEIALLYPIFAIDRSNFHRFANFAKLKNFFFPNLKLFAFLVICKFLKEPL